MAEVSSNGPVEVAFTVYEVKLGSFSFAHTWCSEVSCSA
jgi:hypothetical protein